MKSKPIAVLLVLVMTTTALAIPTVNWSTTPAEYVNNVLNTYMYDAGDSLKVVATAKLTVPLLDPEQYHSINIFHEWLDEDYENVADVTIVGNPCDPGETEFVTTNLAITAQSCWHRGEYQSEMDVIRYYKPAAGGALINAGSMLTSYNLFYLDYM